MFIFIDIDNYNALQTLTGEDIMHHGPNHQSISKEMPLVLGAKRHLEWEHEKYMMGTISRDPVLVLNLLFALVLHSTFCHNSHNSLSSLDLIAGCPGRGGCKLKKNSRLP